MSTLTLESHAEDQVTNESENNLGAPGVLPVQQLKRLIETGALAAQGPITNAQLQPASIDLRLGTKAYRIRASFLPGPRRTVEDRLKDVVMHEIDLTSGAVLETGCVYLVPLMERTALPKTVSGLANPKSSTGRIDVFTRLITDYASSFDQVEAGYEGPLYAEISPKTFSVLVRAGSRLNQLRLRGVNAVLNDRALLALHEKVGLVDGDADIDMGIAVSVDLKGEADTGFVGYRAKRHAGLIDVDRPGAYEASEFWEPITARKDATLILDPDEFYILASREAVHVPPDFAAEMVPFNPLVGEFRVHYAGFFDPGFGHSRAGGSSSRAVLEVRSHDVPFIIEDGQIVGRLVYEPLSEMPDFVYGADIGSHYQRQGLKLSKHFRLD
jgi:dCTP deaminase